MTRALRGHVYEAIAKSVRRAESSIPLALAKPLFTLLLRFHRSDRSPSNERITVDKRALWFHTS